jgi:hypothetical protein
MPSKDKEKYPTLGSTPPEIPHCKAENLEKGGNRHMQWWDCEGCFARIMDLKTQPGNDIIYYSVPPCKLSPNYDPLVHRVTPKQAKALDTPPLCKKDLEFRRVQEPPRYTPQEEEVLKAARRILRESGTDLDDMKKNKPTSNSGQPSAPRTQSVKREAPRSEDSMEEDGYVNVPGRQSAASTDAQLLAQIHALEEAAAHLKANLR